MPLTRDYKVFLNLINDTKPERFKWQGSDLASGIEVAIDLFDEQGAGRGILVDQWDWGVTNRAWTRQKVAQGSIAVKTSVASEIIKFLSQY